MTIIFTALTAYLQLILSDFEAEIYYNSADRSQRLCWSKKVSLPTNIVWIVFFIFNEVGLGSTLLYLLWDFGLNEFIGISKNTFSQKN